tara:strand:+ start:1115 stop:1288 length:174 start_codon:yes stop_codon:yes gene_type:complete
MGHCCIECKKNKKCKSEYTIEKPKPKINMKKLEKKYVNDPLYAMFGKDYILQKKNNI